MNVDKIFEDIGELGREQMKYVAILFLCNLYNAFHMLQYTFVGYSMSFICPNLRDNECPSSYSNYNKCEFTNIEIESTVVSEWFLICADSWLGPLTMSIFMAGVMVGAFVLGGVADSIGRRKCLLINLFVCILVNVNASFVHGFKTYCVLRFIDGFVISGAILSQFVLLNELIGSGKRGTIGLAYQSAFALGIVVASVLASRNRHWRSFTALVSLIGLPVIIFSWILPESPRWLLSKGRDEEAIKVLNRIALGNGKKFRIPRRLSNSSSLSPKSTTFPTDAPVNHGSTINNDTIFSLFTVSFTIFFWTVIQIYSWFVNSLCYYGLTLAAASSSDNPKRDRYTSTMLSGIVEIPAYFLSIILLSICGRKTSLCLFMIIGGIGMLLIRQLEELKFPLYITMGLSMMSKLCTSASFAIIYVHSGEIFPTSIRNSAMGFVSVFARIGGIVSPFIVQLGEDLSPNIHFFIFGILCLSAGILNMKLPETKGKSMPENVKDMMNIKRLHHHVNHSDIMSPNSGYKRLPSEPNDVEYDP